MTRGARSTDGWSTTTGSTCSGVRAVANRARARAYAADPVGFTERGKTERRSRRVSIRPAPDTMAWLSAYLAVEQGAACWAALRRAADAAKAAGDRRTRDQIMADTLVERLTGQGSADAVPLEVRVADEMEDDPGTRAARTKPVGLLVPRTTLAGGADRPGWLPGHGPVPAPLLRSLIAAAKAAGRVRFVSSRSDPEQSSRGRVFRGRLRQHVEDRDQDCRDPFCGGPARRIDHIVPWAAGGATSYANGRAVCERGNYCRELPGWSVRLVDPVTHTVEITTPTGHTYSSQPAPTAVAPTGSRSATGDRVPQPGGHGHRARPRTGRPIRQQSSWRAPCWPLPCWPLCCWPLPSWSRSAGWRSSWRPFRWPRPS